MFKPKLLLAHRRLFHQISVHATKGNREPKNAENDSLVSIPL
jgi:hypothetical protein